MLQQFLTKDYLIAFAVSILRMSTPLIFCAIGAMICNHAGVINMALEGIMLTSALTAVIFSYLTKTAIGGILGAVIGGVLISLILAYLNLKKESDLVITGIALNTFASGGTVYLLFLITGDKGTSRLLPSLNVPNIKIPIIDKIPIIGDILSGHNALTYVSLIMVIVVYLLIFKSKLGLRIRAVGFNPGAASSVGISVRKVKLQAILITGVIASLGGAFMSMGYLSYFAKDMLAGRGFIGMSAATVAGGNALATLLAALGFGAASAAAITLSTLNLKADLVAMIPYVATVVGIVIVSARKLAKARSKQDDID